MKKLNNNSGFTLIEIIVVLIIVGILAAIALPNLFSNVSKSKGAEAVAAMGAIKSNVEACFQKYWGNGAPNDIATNCTTANLNIANSTANFTYALAGQTNAMLGSITLTATSTAGLGTVTLTRTTTVAPQGTYACSGTGSFNGVC